MQPSKPIHTFTDAELLARHHRRRRWMVRLTLLSLLAVAVVAMAFLVLTSTSEVSIEEAKILYAQFSERSSAADFERLLGKSRTREIDHLGVIISSWLYTKHHLFQTDYYTINMHSIEKGTVYYFDHVEGTITGWESWRLRWWLLKKRLGIKEEW